MKIYKTKHFSKWAKKNKVSDHLLALAAEEISNGIVEANLGSSVFKKRIANKGRGKRGSVRTIIVYKQGNHCFFVYAFDKRERSNISDNDEKAFKLLAK